MNHVLRDCKDFAEVYIDDVVVYSKSWSEHIQHLRKVFSSLQEAGLIVELKKCTCGKQQADYLGHTIGKGEVQET